MKLTTISGLILAFVTASASLVIVAEDKKANELLQSGITRETVQGDLKGAIDLYERAVKEAGSSRALSAKAQLRLGLAYQKQGDEKARTVFERIVRDYSDQTEAAAEARARMNTGRPVTVDVAVSVTSASNLRQVHLYDRQGKELGTVNDPRRKGLNATMKISPDGKRVALDRQPGIVTINIATKAVTTITAGPADYQPTWSSDGSRIAYQTISDVYVTSSDGKGIGKEERVYSGISGGFTLVDWSQDGRFLTFHQRETGFANDLWVLPLTGDRKPILILRTPFGETGPHISPDGRFVSYRSNKSGKSEVYVRPFDPAANPIPSPTAEEWKVSVDPGVATAGVHWRSDSKELYYISASGGVMAVEITTTPSFKAGTPKLLFQVPAAYQSATDNTAGYSDVSADGKIFALSVPR